MDGVGYTNDYIRYGSEWPKLVKAYQQDLESGFTTNLLATVQVYNLHNIPDIIQFWKDNGSNNNLILNFVNWPTEFKIDILPMEYKRQVAAEIERVAADIPEKQREMFRINALIQQLSESTPNDVYERRKKFVRRTRAYDKLRNQSITQVSDKLSKLLEKWENE
jgi:sulfatase maturation enzyme AslB (radical SAM superfamily)